MASSSLVGSGSFISTLKTGLGMIKLATLSGWGNDWVSIVDITTTS
jgi:hypothetical protein